MQLAEALGVSQQAGAAQPSLDASKKLAQVFTVTTDFLLFEDAERGPGEDLKPQFEAVSHMSASEKKIIKALLEGMILKHETRRTVGGLSSHPAKAGGQVFYGPTEAFVVGAAALFTNRTCCDSISPCLPMISACVGE